MIQVKPYSAFAPNYNFLLKHVDYQSWYIYLRSIMNKYLTNPETVLELGSGTGILGRKFAYDNFLSYGLDNSLEMLRIAKSQTSPNYYLFGADIKNFSLTKNIDFIFAVHDIINYQLKISDLRQVFNSVKKVMAPHSIFMFDITTEYNVKTNFCQKTSYYNFQGKKIAWSNIFDPSAKFITSTLIFSTPNEPSLVEKHQQRIYSIKEIKKILKEENFEILAIYGDNSFSKPKKKTIMINFITKKTKPQKR